MKISAQNLKKQILLCNVDEPDASIHIWIIHALVTRSLSFQKIFTNHKNDQTLALILQH